MSEEKRKIKFLHGTIDEYEGLEIKDPTTFYRLDEDGESKKVYLGGLELTNTSILSHSSPVNWNKANSNTILKLKDRFTYEELQNVLSDGFMNGNGANRWIEKDGYEECISLVFGNDYIIDSRNPLELMLEYGQIDEIPAHLQDLIIVSLGTIENWDENYLIMDKVESLCSEGDYDIYNDGIIEHKATSFSYFSNLLGYFYFAQQFLKENMPLEGDIEVEFINYLPIWYDTWTIMSQFQKINTATYSGKVKAEFNIPTALNFYSKLEDIYLHIERQPISSELPEGILEVENIHFDNNNELYKNYVSAYFEEFSSGDFDTRELDYELAKLHSQINELNYNKNSSQEEVEDLDTKINIVVYKDRK